MKLKPGLGAFYASGQETDCASSFNPRVCTGL